MLGVKQKVVLGGAAEGRALLPQLGLQSAGQPVAALGRPVVLHRVGVEPTPFAHQSVKSPWYTGLSARGYRMALYSSWRDTIRSCTP